MRKLYVRKIAGNVRYHIPPQSRTLQHIRFVDREQLTTTGAGKIESYASDALDFEFSVAHGVGRDTLAGRAFHTARFTKVEAPKKLAHNENVGALDQVRFQWRAADQCGVTHCGTQVGVRAQFATQA